MSPPEVVHQWFAQHGLADAVRISDPDKHLYRAFGLTDASLSALLHPSVWGPWFRTAILRGYGFGAAGPNWRQLTGTFVVHRGRILAAVRHRNSAERPDYLALVRGVANK
jgi:hypothetical protein